MLTKDYKAICELKYNYCYYLDNGNVKEFPNLFTNDAEFEVRSTHGLISDRKALQEWVEWRQNSIIKNEEIREINANVHIPLNPIIKFEDNRATGKWYFLVIIHYSSGEFELGQGQYQDIYKKVDGKWKIKSLKAKRQLTIMIGGE